MLKKNSFLYLKRGFYWKKCVSVDFEFDNKNLQFWQIIWCTFREELERHSNWFERWQNMEFVTIYVMSELFTCPSKEMLHSVLRNSKANIFSNSFDLCQKFHFFLFFLKKKKPQICFLCFNIICLRHYVFMIEKKLTNVLVILEHFRSINFYIGSNVRDAVNDGRADYIPITFNDIPKMFYENTVLPDVALIHVSAPDERGFCSFGTNADITKAAASTAKVIIGKCQLIQTNHNLHSNLHLFLISSKIQNSNFNFFFYLITFKVCIIFYFLISAFFICLSEKLLTGILCQKMQF